MILDIVRIVADLAKEWFDSEDQRREFINDVQTRLIQNESQLIESRGKAVIAEAKGESWLQRNWRPMLMLSIVAIVVNNYLLLPWMRFLGFNMPILNLPSELFDLMTVGVGGYILGRSGEKITKGLPNKRLPWRE